MIEYNVINSFFCDVELMMSNAQNANPKERRDKPNITTNSELIITVSETEQDRSK